MKDQVHSKDLSKSQKRVEQLKPCCKFFTDFVYKKTTGIYSKEVMDILSS